MTNLQVLAIEAFIIAGAHYVRNADDAWYAIWMATALAFVLMNRFCRIAEKREP